MSSTRPRPLSCESRSASRSVYFKCEDTIFAISNIEKLFFGKTFDSAASGEITRPAESLFFLMYAQIFFVTSVRAIFDPPQIAARSELSVFGAKRPFPAFFIAAATFLPFAFWAVLPALFLAAVMALSTDFGVFGFLTVVLTVV